MKRTIIVTTDFTVSSRNALAYTCGLTASREFELLLVHVYSMPVNYSGDGVSIAAMGSAFDSAEERLAIEIEWVKTSYPDTIISGKAMVGGLVASLKEEIRDVNPEVVVMGAADDYADLWEWDNELLKALTNLPVPVLIIPKQIAFKPIHNIGFACDYRNLCIPSQVSFIKTIISATHAQLHVVHITRSKTADVEIKKKNESLLQSLLADVQPVYYDIEDPNVIDAATRFVKEHNLDMLIVIPHKHDIWYSIFHESHTKQLARLNNMPILALHD